MPPVARLHMNLTLLLFLILPLDAYPAKHWQECPYILGVSKWYYSLAVVEKLPEDNLILLEEGFEPEEFALLQQIKHDAWHDHAALKARLDKVCTLRSNT